MRVADLYIRVSTEEQADKGYSQRNQEEMLRRYCENNDITINNVLIEDHSAKSFIRPEWTRYLTILKQPKNRSELVLFTKWDRFSRNAGDAYQMINHLRKVGVEPQAIEQPLDFDIPENKIMLALYLATPEVENDRRALNVFHGMRRAKKEGRALGIAPIGYKNRITEDGKKYFGILEPQATYIQWVFDELAKGVKPADQIRKEVNRMGLKCGSSVFWTMVRNPIYCGLVFVPAYKDEEERFVNGTHEPIISEELFYDVQDVLDGKKRKVKSKAKNEVEENFPLRGFLQCPNCGGMLTGSSSKGKSRYYSYYHCQPGCKFRHRAEEANELFERELRKFIPHPAIKELYKVIVGKLFADYSRPENDERRRIADEIDRLSEKMSKARNLLLTDVIDANDYKVLKEETEISIKKAESKLNTIGNKKFSQPQVEKLMDKAITTLSRLDTHYGNMVLSKKRELIGSIFPEKIVFDGKEYRTPRLNEAARLIYMINNDLYSTKNRKGHKSAYLSGQVESPGIEPGSKQGSKELSTRLVPDWVFDNAQGQERPHIT
ncbi:resolvase [Flavobacterium subsaxonicum WB 4.1-42 = DSM 21790]|uniref:Resolvase n=1 Tax=Flavobacterium subsaxonicum WB 4.1-42 = DSM 21790 TaxID=1121898 RepID=A0A0A2MQT2_9FLAO|nr:resolvase [Flavobacterium subsaxonicum WB 4.1-42 = DSM 21790]